MIQDALQHAGGQLHGERRRAEDDDLAADIAVWAAGSEVEPQHAPAAEEVAHDPHGRDGLGKHRGQGGPLHSPGEAEDEDRRQYRVEHHADEHRQHGDLGVALAADGGVQAEGDRLENGPQHDDSQVVAGVGQDRLAGAEERAGWESSQSRAAAVTRMDVITSSAAVLPSTRSASAFLPSPSRMEISAVPPKPISMRKASTTSMKGKATVVPAMPVGAQGVADEDPVDQIVSGLGHHADDGRQRRN